MSHIAAGDCYSLAVTDQGEMFSWGEAKMGQLGLGRFREVRTPRQIEFPNNAQIVTCEAGFGHTVALSTQGALYTWGFNTYGQVGLGDKKTHWAPTQIKVDAEGNEMQPIIKVACSNYATYAIDALGQPFSWGKGFIGHQHETSSALPAKIQFNTDNRIFTDVYTNGDSALLFAPVRVYQIEPKCGPAKGGTQIRITGTGFSESDKLCVRFTFGDKQSEVSCYYDDQDGSIVCKTPSFMSGDDSNMQLPCNCSLSVTLDGVNFSDCEETFMIYSNEIFLSAVNPKCGSVAGGSQVTLSIEIDPVTASNLQNLKIGFQPKGKKLHSDSSKAKASLGDQTNSRRNLEQTSKGEQDIEAWTCAEGFYENGCIICTVPKIESYDPDNMTYSVDVALNGQ